VAQFRGTLRGQRGEASRLGSKVSGLEANVASWQGAVRVSLWTRDDGVDMARVELGQHSNGAGLFPPQVLYDGPISGKDFPINVNPTPAEHAEAVRRLKRQEA
jgi:hypothetical protein